MSKLIIMVGLPGSGKSTLADKLANESIILSSDELRGVIGFSQEDQSVSGEVFRTMETMTAYFLKRGQSVIIDATNTTKRARFGFVLIGRKYGAWVEAWVVECDPNTAKQRNAQRSRVVPDDVIDRMAAQWQQPEVGEFDSVSLFD
jgi:predicted kinase